MTAPVSCIANHTNVYQSVCANRHENSIHYSQKLNRLLYSRCNCPVLYNPQSNQVILFLYGHSAEVNGLCFVLQSDTFEECQNVISTSYDKTAIIWDVSEGESEARILYKLVSPDDNVFTSRSCIRNKDADGSHSFLSITSTLDSSIFIWRNDKLVSSVRTKYYSFNSKIHSVRHKDQDVVFLFLAGSDNRIHVFQIQDNNLIELFDLTGHSDWVKSLDTIDLKGRSLEFLVASASQDAYVRVWHMKIVDHDIDQSQVRTTVSKTLSLSSIDDQLKLTATLETVLSGHENIIHGLSFLKQTDDSTLQLFTCSADKTIIIWKSSVAPPPQSDSRQQLHRYDQCPATAEVWKEILKLGETGETNLPFLDISVGHIQTSSSAESKINIFALSLRGAIHNWLYKDGQLESLPSIMGHFDSVTDLCWDRSGSYLLTGSLDKTTRLHTTVLDKIESNSENKRRWYEVARPVVHGHELNCLTSLGFSKFAIGAEEKTIRTFQATQFFMRNFDSLSTINLSEQQADSWASLGDLPKHAQLPALGLSNKAAQVPYDVKDPNDENISATKTWYDTSKLVEQLSHVDHLDKLPNEEILLQSSLWWESNKLFGHSNELHTMVADSTGSYLASASRANRKDLANVIIWECSRFRKAATIEHHALTVTRLRFSPNDNYLLSVSRDRTWCISEKTGAQRPAFKKVYGTSKANSGHERIIWDCSWTCDSKYFVTVSRDKRAVLWSLKDVLSQTLISAGDGSKGIAPVLSHQLPQSIQAVDSPEVKALGSSSYWFAFGLEDGSLELHAVETEPGKLKWTPVKVFENYHHLPIRRLAFAPQNHYQKQSSNGEVKEDSLLLASGGDDCVVKVTSFNVC